MLFSSPAFFLFFGLYFLLHVLVPARWQLALIIAGSTIFYGYWNPWYMWIPYALTALAFVGAAWTERARGEPAHARRLGLTVAALLLPLVVVKYTNFIYGNVFGVLFGVHGSVVSWPLPLGVSFMTFTMISYVVDVYRGRYPLEKRAGMLTGLVLFFPHLIAGPILRPHDLLPQLSRLARPTRALGRRIVFGLAIFSVGLLKKLAFADQMATIVAAVYAPNGLAQSAADYLLAWYAFAVQIYCDFSGYTDMAIGIAMMLGVRLPTNFLHPYTSASIVEFWRRWHITLSTWLRDYLYIPLGGNRQGHICQIRNIVVTMALGGLWHGAGWTFVIWGLWHGAGIASVHLLRRGRIGKMLHLVPRSLMVLLTFHFVIVGWILFRSPDLAIAWRVFAGPFSQPLGDLGQFASSQTFALILLMLFFVTHRWDTHRTIRHAVQRTPAAMYWLVIVCIWTLAITLSHGSSANFIYFDF
jgi:alginate O-acetyltransferase complex protein AlgI